MNKVKLKKYIDKHMARVPEIKKYCDRCLATMRYNGNVSLMVVDAAFTSIGLNYFNSVVPKVLKFYQKFKIESLKDLIQVNVDEARKIWKNRRSWNVIFNVAKYLLKLMEDFKLNEREALRFWAKNASIEKWKEDPVGSIKGIGINTFQYLRMMGGIDTVMPDKIVKKVINKILIESDCDAVWNDLLFIKKVHEIAKITGYRAIDICWMTWLVQYNDEKIRKYSKILEII